MSTGPESAESTGGPYWRELLSIRAGAPPDAPASGRRSNLLAITSAWVWENALCEYALTMEAWDGRDRTGGRDQYAGAEVWAAHTKAAGTANGGVEVHFPIQTLTVELKVGLTKLADGKVGFKVPFVGAEVGASAGLHQESTQTVTLVLGPPVDQRGQPVSVAQATDKEKG